MVEDQVLIGDEIAATESMFERDNKKRHASGDSGFGGDEASSLAKKVKVDDKNEDAKTIKNSDLDSKLDKILDIFEDKKKIDKQCIKPFTTESVTEESDLIRKLKYCRSMKEITELGFVYDMELR